MLPLPLAILKSCNILQLNRYWLRFVINEQVTVQYKNYYISWLYFALFSVEVAE